ncbi:hypothetical protein [Nocardioides bigeumensis]|uniref:Uncharacterized protein n=1 Tax=Nocardioides bigeumensis TaxID=433657 RepID=A0ABN2YCE8_9ACTN
MPVVIGELEVVAAAPPAPPGPDVGTPPPPMTALDVARIVARERERVARKEAD